MKDLSQLVELPIKIDVSTLTHEERGELQKKLFEHGVEWADGDTEPDTRSEFNFISKDKVLTHKKDNSRSYFEGKLITEIKIEKLQEILGMKQKQFTKSDLKDGMVVMLRNDPHRHLVLNGKVLATDGYFELYMYNNDLCYSLYDTQDFDIMEVFEVVRVESLNIEYWNLKSIWKREEKTAAQLEIESIQKQMDELNARLETLKAGM